MKAKYSSKEAYDKKIGIVSRRIDTKSAYVSALIEHCDNLRKSIQNTDGVTRSGYAVEYFEVLEKLNAQKSILSQHKMYLEEMKKIAPNE